MTKYYSLMVYENGFWSQQFGDYDKKTVEYERQDYLDHGYKSKDIKIVVTDEEQTAIEAAVDALNGYNPDLIERKNND